MKQIKAKAVIFDLDGTLLDSSEDIADSMNMALKEHGLPDIELKQYLKFIGRGISNLIIDTLSFLNKGEAPEEDMIDKVLASMRKIYNTNYNKKSRLYPGIENLLEILKEKNIPVSVLSNKPHNLTAILCNEMLSAYDLCDCLGHRSSYQPKPDTRAVFELTSKMKVLPEHTILAGDTEVDIQTAANAGLAGCIAVSWGFRPVEELQQAHSIIHQPEELLNFVEV